MITINKQPAEILPLAFEFHGKLPLGAQIYSGTFSAIDIDDSSDVTMTLLISPTGTISGTKVNFGVRAGTDGHNYKVTLMATLTDNSILEEDVIISVGEI